MCLKVEQKNSRNDFLIPAIPSLRPSPSRWERVSEGWVRDAWPAAHVAMQVCGVLQSLEPVLPPMARTCTV